MDRTKITRRELLKGTAGLAVGAALGCHTAGGKAPTVVPPEIAAHPAAILNYRPTMGYRRLGRTGLIVSEIGLGGHYFYKGEKYTTQDYRNQVVSACLEAGINFFETTDVPGEAETTGTALRGRRNGVYITHDFAAMRQGEEWSRSETLQRGMDSIEMGLRWFHTDVIDIWRPSARQAGGTSMRLTEWVVEAGLLAKQQGKIRFLGISAHDAPWLIRTLHEFDAFDLIVTPYNYCFRQAETELFALVRERDLGVMAIKPFLGESLFRREIPQWNREQEDVTAHERGFQERTQETDPDRLAVNALRFVLSRPEISLVVPGMSTAEEVKNNVKAARCGALSEPELQDLGARYEIAAAALPERLRWLEGWRLA
ncbi:MAG: aldo/keto reductase [Planctomycetota bacterium]